MKVVPLTALLGVLAGSSGAAAAETSSASASSSASSSKGERWIPFIYIS